MKRVLQHSVLATAIAGGLLAAAPAHAITNVEANAGPQFNFVNPGARSLGMGGAFVGLADDSTAAYTNPAGLGQLSRREFAVEARYTQFHTLSASGGRLLDSPTGVGLDTVSGLQEQTTTTDVTNLSFLSFAFPLEHGTLAFYRHELANFEAHFASDGAFVQNVGDDVSPPRVSRATPTINDSDLEIANYGFAGSWRVNDRLMLGGSLNYYRFDIDTRTRRYDLDADHNGLVTNAEKLNVLDFSDSELRDVLTQNGSDSAFGFNLGLLWLPNDKWSVGAVYRKGPDFDYDFRSVVLGTTIHEGSTDFVVPDMFAVGIGYRPNDAWRLSFDLAQVYYSQHADNVVEQSTDGDVDYLDVDDTLEVRLGAEYTNAEAAHPYSIRFGAWREPAHQVYYDAAVIPYTGTPLTVEQSRQNSKATQFIEGRDAWHITGGFGVVFDKFQIDAAVDLSNRSDVLSLSMVYFFK
jgi:long-subunit fatty acid transport protein